MLAYSSWRLSDRVLTIHFTKFSISIQSRDTFFKIYGSSTKCLTERKSQIDCTFDCALDYIAILKRKVHAYCIKANCYLFLRINRLLLIRRLFATTTFLTGKFIEMDYILSFCSNNLYFFVFFSFFYKNTTWHS